MVQKASRKAKGFRVPKRTAKLVFEDDYAGAEVRVQLDVPIQLYIDIQDLVDAEKHLEVFGLFGRAVLLDWNLEDDDGQPIPANAAGFVQLPPGFGNLIIQEWMDEVTRLPGPLAERSNGGSM
jgi:hypothetical protein